MDAVPYSWDDAGFISYSTEATSMHLMSAPVSQSVQTSAPSPSRVDPFHCWFDKGVIGR